MSVGFTWIKRPVRGQVTDNPTSSVDAGTGRLQHEQRMNPLMDGFRVMGTRHSKKDYTAVARAQQ